MGQTFNPFLFKMTHVQYLFLKENAVLRYYRNYIKKITTFLNLSRIFFNQLVINIFDLLNTEKEAVFAVTQ